jgi:hypothetical protein
MSILDVIAEQRRADVAQAKLQVSEETLRARIQANEPALDVIARLHAPAVRSGFQDSPHSVVFSLVSCVWK